MYWLYMAIAFVGVLVVAVGLIMAMGILGLLEAFGIFGSDGILKHTDTKRPDVLRKVARVLGAGLGLTALGFGLMILAEG